MNQLGLAAFEEDSTNANTAVTLLEEVRSDWEAWTVMDHPQAIPARQWLQEQWPLDLDALEEITRNPLWSAFDRYIRVYQLTNDRWFAWLTLNTQWDELKAQRRIDGQPPDESLKKFVPLPLFWILDESQDDARQGVWQAIALYLLQ